MPPPALEGSENLIPSYKKAQIYAKRQAKESSIESPVAASKMNLKGRKKPADMMSASPPSPAKNSNSDLAQVYLDEDVAQLENQLMKQQ